MKYDQVYDGMIVRPFTKGYKMRCCDCGLVHLLMFKVVRVGKVNHISFKSWRDNRATAQVRRHMKGGRE